MISVEHGLVGDKAHYNNSTNVLTACDHSSGNGTARAILQVIDGNSKQVYDSNGFGSGCGSVGPLNVNNSKHAYLFICATADNHSCYRTLYDFPV